MKLLVFIIVSTSFALFSQEVSYGFSKKFKTVKKHASLGFLKFNSNDYLELHYRKGKDMVFQVFDQDFESIKRRHRIIFKYLNQLFMKLID